jgi:hypothetical protein
MLFELDRCEVIKAGMRPNYIVVPTRGFNDDLGLAPATEPLHAQACVAESSIEALVHAVLPRLARIDQRSLNPCGLEPLENRFAHELRALGRTQVAGRAVLADKARQNLDDASRANAARRQSPGFRG